MCCVDVYKRQTSTFQKVEVTAVSGNVIITAPVEAMDVSLRSISGRVRTEGVNIREGEDVPSVRVTGVTADLKLCLLYTSRCV